MLYLNQVQGLLLVMMFLSLVMLAKKSKGLLGGITIFCFPMILVFLLVGCVSQEKFIPSLTPSAGAWADLYNEIPMVQGKTTRTLVDSGPSLSYVVEEMPLPLFVRQLALDSGYSIVWAASLDSSIVSLSLTNVPCRDVIKILARRLGVEMVDVGTVIYLGEILPDDRSHFVGHITRLDPDVITEVIQGMLSSSGQLIVIDGGLVILSDRLIVIDNVLALLDQISGVSINSWLLQFYLVEVGENLDSNLGVDSDIEFQMSTVLSQVAVSDLEYSGRVAAAFHSEINSGSNVMVAKPVFVLLDGGESDFKKVSSIPVPKYTTSVEGSVSVSGYTYIQSGFDMSVSIRDWSDSEYYKAKVTYAVTVGDVTGYVGQVPIQSQSILNGEIVCTSGFVYLVGSLVHESESESRTGLAGLLFGKTTRTADMRLWLRILRI